MYLTANNVSALRIHKEYVFEYVYSLADDGYDHEYITNTRDMYSGTHNTSDDEHNTRQIHTTCILAHTIHHTTRMMRSEYTANTKTDDVFASLSALSGALSGA